MWVSTLKRYAGIVFYRTLAGIKSEGRQNYLGYLWFLLEPMLSTLVLYIAFSQITGKGGPEYVVFLILGMITWQWFESSCMLGATAIKAKYGVLTQFNLPKYIFPIVSIMVNTWKFLCVFVVILVTAAVFGYTPNFHYVYLPGLMLLQLLLIIGVTLPLTIGATLMNDLLTVVSSIFRLLFFMSGIFFDASLVPENLKSLFYANPMAVFIESYRAVVIHNQPPQMSHLAEAGLVSMAFLALGMILHAYYDKKILKLTNA
ncbi:lipopolysaccharide transport system permease protein [Ereboglobus sp. PH5-5]|uniref:ABC transporter permease n=1 Tax=unclassified Ereboglobus TaxID=2626932 RepID=UPI002405B2BC|nr:MULTISPECIES: ABC transporter permease [unclassified Ereboglobus]MDF9828233.1 lipopolysaccharide transport system permease protein [Ereboglobus sp. PH5-10]MDF9832397.1 lipopolysaccharide transport system permease protein [Ereboglobus sp. PH5-5]